MSTLHIIAAMSEHNRVIGNKNELPWHIPHDLERFKKITSGHPIIMGRNTYISIGRPLPHRTNIILTRTHHFPEIITAASLKEALEKAHQAPGGEDVFIIGGEHVYKEALPKADILHLTLIHCPYKGDAFFPDYSDFTTEQMREEHTDASPPFTYVDLKKN